MTVRRTDIQKLKSRIIKGIKLRRTDHAVYVEFFDTAGRRLFMVNEQHLYDGNGNFFEGVDDLPVVK